MANIGKQIKEFRMKKDMTQDELADKLFVSRQTISNYENNKSHPDIEVLVQLAEIFETDVNTLICGDEINIEFRNKIKKYIIKIITLIICIFMLVISQNAIMRLFHGDGNTADIFVKFTEYLGLNSHRAYSVQVTICFSILYINLYIIHPSFAVLSGYHAVEGILLLHKKEYIKWKYVKYLHKTVQSLLAFYYIIMLPGWIDFIIIDQIDYFRWMMIDKPGAWSSSPLEMIPIWANIEIIITHFMVNYQELNLLIFFTMGGILGITKTKKNKE